MIDYEKKYNEALGRAKQKHGKFSEFVTETIEEIFPELRESEDERIRTQLLDFLEHLHSQGTTMDFDVWCKADCANWILWVEKQKEQKPCGCVNVESEYDKGWRDGHKAGLKDAEMQKSAWSEEDNEYYDTIVRKLEIIGDDCGLSNNQIKFLREHCPSHRSEWSEEDYYAYSIILNEYKQMYEHRTTSLTRDDIVAGYNFLKSLRPQPHWKPSEEQMAWLKLAIDEAKEPLKSQLEELYKNIRENFIWK